MISVSKEKEESVESFPDLPELST